MKIISKLAILGACLTFLVSCSLGDSPGEKIYNHLEKAAELESGFNKQQEPLVEAEKAEQKLYEQMIALDMKDFDKIVALSDKALASVDKREELLNKEKESMDKASEEFVKIKPTFDDIDDAKLKEKANKLYDIMNKRYETYDKLHKDYLDSMTEDRKLYTMLKKKDLAIEDLQKQIDVVNESYKKVNDEKEAFNNYTKEYNDAKKAFYEEADLNVETDK